MDDVRFGRVSSTDKGQGLCSVTFEDRGNTTPPLPVLAARFPEKEQLVAVLYSSGNPALVLGEVWNKANIPQDGATLQEIIAKQQDHEQRIAALEAAG